MAEGARIAAVVGLTLLISGAAPISTVAGHVQVKAAAGVEVQIDERRGTSEDDHGVTFREISPGAHTLQAHRPGYVSQHALIWVHAGEVTVHRLAPWQKQVPSLGTGAIIIQTLPVDATVSAQSLGYNKILKSDAPVVLPRVPAGRHKLTFCTEYKCIDYRAEVEAQDVVSLLVDFEPGEVHDVSTTFISQVRTLTQDCLRQRDTNVCKQACALATSVRRESPACEATTAPTVDVGMHSDDEATIPASARRALP